MGNEDLGTHYHKIGDLASALKAFARMRDYCTTPAHIASTAFNIILVGIEQRNWLAVQSQVHKIRNLQMKPDDSTRSQPKTATAQGLHHMCMGEYKDAARSFLQTGPTLTDTFNEVITANDVAIYGGLCSLASMNRAELQEQVLENSSFRNFLELEPQIRRAINLFCASKYGQCLEILEGYRADYLLDIYLQDHVSSIFKQVRTKSIIQYFEPFSRVTLDALAKTFGPSLSTAPVSGANGASTIQPLEHEIIELIESGQLSARIDLEARVLVAKERDLRTELYEEATGSIENFIREARMKLLRTNVIRAGLEITPPAKNKGGWSNDGSGDVAESWAASAGGTWSTAPGAPVVGRQIRSGGKGKW
jgi:COP9 signalosome complex subunit 1